MSTRDSAAWSSPTAGRKMRHVDAPGNAHCVVGPGPSQSSPAGAPGNGRAERYRAVFLRSVAL